jgi:hypothetical protein
MRQSQEILKDVLTAFDKAVEVNGDKCLSKRMRDLRAEIRAFINPEPVAVTPKPQASQAGADLTSFGDGLKGAKKFQAFLNGIGITDPVPKRGIRDEFVWNGPDIQVVTANNPISGEYYRKGQRENEQGYASYMGFSGTPEKIKLALKLLKKHAEFIKKIDPKRRQFI